MLNWVSLYAVAFVFSNEGKGVGSIEGCSTGRVCQAEGAKGRAAAGTLVKNEQIARALSERGSELGISCYILRFQFLCSFGLK